ncbi:NUDIX hydrolase [Sinomicrobium weinanense]|uniref:NUDIX domain-containing protein n=1 Tax=Sinomicrobium weinanense TaxID=2842200 RepID=A0A926JRR5_9FLAO|nr:NUDIX domain-containing protein [Sinomicrobium weinanense]MBC9796077.1 NUDIX domain-containing protein [Sinomicrobium weinanense]MBU3124746.1 NUDIX domain-containing protein [Sinomicrobium weinanense]
MYEVFVNDYPIILTNILTKEVKHKLFLLESVSIEEVIKQLNKGEMQSAHLYYPKEGQLIKKLSEKIPLVVAAGGLVTNAENEVLFIYRNGKWDLPKGKLEKKESIEEAALREVEEETGVRKLKLGPLLQKTYHIFKRNGTYKLKETHWFSMTSTYKGKFQAQYEEGIEKVEWKKPAEIPEALQNSYANIKVLFHN